MSIYKGTTLIAGALPNAVNQDLSNLSQTGQAIIDGKADTDLSNLTSTASANFDGEIVIPTTTTIASNVSLNSSTNLEYTLDIPNDGNAYLVLLSAQIETGSSSGNIATLQLGSDLVSNVDVCRARTRTSSTVTASGSVWLPVSSSRKLIVYRWTNNGTLLSLDIRAYRRIGTNE